VNLIPTCSDVRAATVVDVAPPAVWSVTALVPSAYATIVIKITSLRETG